jgi:hypothetical protein
MEEQAVKNFVEKIGDSIVCGPEQEVSPSRLDDWKGEYVMLDICHRGKKGLFAYIISS